MTEARSPSPQHSFVDFLRGRVYDPEATNELTDRIESELLAASDALCEPNFTSVAASDLEWLFAAYDDLFFEGRLGHLARLPGHDLSFRLSSRMTRVGGTTTRRVRKTSVKSLPRRISHEIAVSTTLLYETFENDPRPITVTGILCTSRVQALQRIFEHELIHLIELLIWEDSSCRKERFESLARNFFAHQEMTHQLITPRERAAVEFDIRTGDVVEFTHQGRTYHGLVNRITKRATVLVEDASGTRYSDGRHYRKFYVPVASLRKRKSA